MPGKHGRYRYGLAASDDPGIISKVEQFLRTTVPITVPNCRFPAAKKRYTKAPPKKNVSCSMHLNVQKHCTGQGARGKEEKEKRREGKEQRARGEGGEAEHDQLIMCPPGGSGIDSPGALRIQIGLRSYQ